jgi:hypothetical protein
VTPPAQDTLREALERIVNLDGHPTVPPPDYGDFAIAIARDALAREQTSTPDAEWAARASEHCERQEWVAARHAADVADHMRYYRLHVESLRASSVDAEQGP